MSGMSEEWGTLAMGRARKSKEEQGGGPECLPAPFASTLLSQWIKGYFSRSLEGDY